MTIEITEEERELVVNALEQYAEALSRHGAVPKEAVVKELISRLTPKP